MQTTNLVPATVEQPPPVRGRRGQTLVEFALTLPLLLLLLLGIIEFGRIFQAWVTLQNAARTAARYAVTGRYDQTIFQNTDAYDADVKNNTGFDANGVPIVQSAATIMDWNPADGYASYSVVNGRVKVCAGRLVPCKKAQTIIREYSPHRTRPGRCGAAAR